MITNLFFEPSKAEISWLHDRVRIRIVTKHNIAQAIILPDATGVAVIEDAQTGEDNAYILNVDGSSRSVLKLPFSDGTFYYFLIEGDELHVIFAQSWSEWNYAVDPQKGTLSRKREAR